MILTFISLVLLVAYIVYAIRLIKGIPFSISDTYYQLEKHNHPKWLFQLYMIVPAFLLLPAWLDLPEEHLQFLAFLSCGGLIFVGAAPCFKLELEGKIHYSATIICGISGLAWVCLTGFWLIPLILFALGIYFTYRYQKPLFWTECALFISVYLSVIWQLL